MYSIPIVEGNRASVLDCFIRFFFFFFFFFFRTCLFSAAQRACHLGASVVVGVDRQDA